MILRGACSFTRHFRSPFNKNRNASIRCVRECMRSNICCAQAWPPSESQSASSGTGWALAMACYTPWLHARAMISRRMQEDRKQHPCLRSCSHCLDVRLFTQHRSATIWGSLLLAASTAVILRGACSFTRHFRSPFNKNRNASIRCVRECMRSNICCAQAWPPSESQILSHLSNTGCDRCGRGVPKPAEESKL